MIFEAKTQTQKKEQGERVRAALWSVESFWFVTEKTFRVGMK